MSTKKLFIIFAFLNSNTIRSVPPIASYGNQPYSSTTTNNCQTPENSYASQFPGVGFIPMTTISILNNCASCASPIGVSSSSTPAVVNLVAPVAPSDNVPVAALTIISRNRSRSASEATQASHTDNTPATSLKRTRSLLNQLCLLEESESNQSSYSHIKIQA